MEHLLEIAAQLESADKASRSGKRCFIGFDGTTDEILAVVDRRESPTQFRSLPTIAALGDRISAAAGKSCNLELVEKRRKIGGNGPILAVALLEGKHDIHYAGTLGEPGQPESLFAPLTQRCSSVTSLGPSSTTWALEFQDGKVLLGRLEAFQKISLKNLLEQLPTEKLRLIHEEVDLFVSANWTMLFAMNEIWDYLFREVAPHLSNRSEERPRRMFVDLADPAKREDSAIEEALALLGKLEGKYQVTLGLNEAEAARIAQVCGVDASMRGEDGVRKLAERVRASANLSQVVVHAVQYAVVAEREIQHYTDGPYFPSPILTTGAGDNFNAGYCNGLLLGLGAKGALITGVSTSGFYVSQGRSPTLSELAQFLRKWHDGEF